MKSRTIERRPPRPMKRRNQAGRRDTEVTDRREDKVDESLKETFPASDPPSRTILTGIGAPKAYK
jgi:hypothetical protein